MSEYDYSQIAQQLNEDGYSAVDEGDHVNVELGRDQQARFLYEWLNENVRDAFTVEMATPIDFEVRVGGDA